MEGGAWCARDISLRAQKKFLSRVGGVSSARALVLDEQAAKLLDQVSNAHTMVFMNIIIFSLRAHKPYRRPDEKLST